MRYPVYFTNEQGNEVARISKEVSTDGTPRYIVNPNSPENTYTLRDCLKDWNPVYRYYVGDKVEWTSTYTKNKFSCLVKNVKRRDNTIKIVADFDSENPMPYCHYYVEPYELTLKQ